MDKSAEGWMQLLKSIVTSTSSFPVFLVADEQEAIQVEANPQAKGNPDGGDIIFKQGRELALQCPHFRLSRNLHVTQIGLGVTPEGERITVSMLDKDTGEMSAIPYEVVRDSKGKIVDVIDTGGVIQIAGAFLYAFRLGIQTANQPEKQALQALHREMQRLAKDITREAGKRGMEFIMPALTEGGKAEQPVTDPSDGLNERDRAYIQETVALQDAMVVGTEGLTNIASGKTGEQVFAWIDTAKWKEAESLADAHASGREGDVQFTWNYLHAARPSEETFFILEAKFLSPVRSVLRLAVPLSEWGGIVEGLLHGGMLSLCFGPAPDWRKLVAKHGTRHGILRTLQQTREIATLNMPDDMLREMRSHYDQWEQSSPK